MALSAPSARGVQSTFLSLGEREVPCRSDGESSDGADVLFILEVGSLLHGDLTEGVDPHASVGEVHLTPFNLDLGEREVLSEQNSRRPS